LQLGLEQFLRPAHVAGSVRASASSPSWTSRASPGWRLRAGLPLLEAELQEAIEKAIRALPEKQRWRWSCDVTKVKSYEEIGEVLGLTVAAVKSLLFAHGLN